MPLSLQIILGSVREARVAKPVGDWVYATARSNDDFTVELIDLKEWDLPMFALPKSPAAGDYTDPLQRRWAEKISAGDAYLFVSPEYNHGYSPVLKNALDYLYAEWNRKPATAVTYGGAKGARSLEQLRGVMIALQLAPLRYAVQIERVWSKLDDGGFKPAEGDDKQLAGVLGELAWWGTALKNARES